MLVRRNGQRQQFHHGACHLKLGRGGMSPWGIALPWAMLQLLYWAQEVAFHRQRYLWFHQEGGKVEPTGDSGGTRCVETRLVFGGLFSAVEANSLCSGQEGRRLLGPLSSDP